MLDMKKAIEKLKGKDISVEETKVKIQATVKSGGVEELIRDEESIIDEGFFEKNPPRVWMDYSVTKNLGNYESLKFNVGISVPVGQKLPEELTSQIMETYEYASDKIGVVIEKELAATIDLLKKKSNG